MESKGKVNCYNCTECGHKHYTLNLVTGTTPFDIKCKKCGGFKCYSSFYVLQEQPIVGYVWYRPKKPAFIRLDKSTQDHIMNGGLLLHVLEQIDYIDDDVPINITKEEWDKIASKFYA